jgi:methionyl-tRNA synthetase
MSSRVLTAVAWPYANGPRHIGHVSGFGVPSDIFARYMRMSGHEVLMISGTDEHGTPILVQAEREGLSPRETADKYNRVIVNDLRDLGLSYDLFTRTTTLNHYAVVQGLFLGLHRNGYVVPKITMGAVSPSTGRTLPDRYIEGTCPNCGYPRARGDQCENCTKQLDPTDLIEPHSAISGSTELELRETKHLYLRQSLLRDRLRAWIDSKADWPLLSTSIAHKWLDDGEGLQDRSITRDLIWGIPVRRGTEPWPGMEGKVLYVWFDAPIEYIGATAEWADAHGLGEAGWERWWRTDKGAEDVSYVQFMGKDNVPFHTLSFPATLIGSGDPWKLVDYIKSFNYLNYEGGKFSTSQGRGVFMDQALDILPADYWRWWLMSNVPEGSDANFTWESFQAGVNKDLADVLGNFVSRVTKFAASRLGDRVPAGGEYGPAETVVTEEIARRLASYEAAIEAIDLRKAAQELRAIWVAGNEYLQAAAPWVAIRTDPDRAAATVRFSLNLIRLYGILSRPFIPVASDTMLAALHLDAAAWPDDVATALDALTPGDRFEVPGLMFAKLDDARTAELSLRFSGSG